MKKSWAEREAELRKSHNKNSPYTVGHFEAGKALQTICNLPRGPRDLGQGALFS